MQLLLSWEKMVIIFISNPRSVSRVLNALQKYLENYILLLTYARNGVIIVMGICQ